MLFTSARCKCVRECVCQQQIWHSTGPISLIFFVHIFDFMLKDLSWLWWFTMVEKPILCTVLHCHYLLNPHFSNRPVGGASDQKFAKNKLYLLLICCGPHFNLCPGYKTQLWGARGQTIGLRSLEFCFLINFIQLSESGMLSYNTSILFNASKRKLRLYYAKHSSNPTTIMHTCWTHRLPCTPVARPHAQRHTWLRFEIWVHFSACNLYILVEIFCICMHYV